PERSLTIVDLPAPFSPMSACTLPVAIAIETSATATVAPNVLRRLTTDTAVPPDASVMTAPCIPTPPPAKREVSRRRRLGPAFMPGSVFGLADERGVQADFRRLLREDRGEPAGVGDNRR